jgi:magnesium chelatase subunit H
LQHIKSLLLRLRVGKTKGPPPAVKKVLSMFGSGREEDRMTGYLSFLKIGPQLLKFIPGKWSGVVDCSTLLTAFWRVKR